MLIAQVEAVVLDANTVISIAAKVDTTEVKVLDAIAQYTASGCFFYAPGVIVSEVLFALCQKEQNNLLTPDEY